MGCGGGGGKVAVLAVEVVFATFSCR